MLFQKLIIKDHANKHSLKMLKARNGDCFDFSS